MSGKNGDRVILQCQVDSNPTPEYTWMKNGDAFEVRRVIKNVVVDELMNVILDCWHRLRAKLQSNPRY